MSLNETNNHKKASNKRQKITLTAIIFNYNNASTLHRSVKAAISQSIPFDEIIIFDDASSDHSVKEILYLTKNKQSVKIIQHKENVGVNANIKEGFKKATSDFVYLMSSQHDYSTEIMSVFRNKVHETPKLVMVSANINKMSKKGKLVEHKLPFPILTKALEPDDLKQHYRKGIVTFYGGGNIIHRKTVIELNLFREEMEWHSDWYMYQMLGLTGPVGISSSFLTTHPYKDKRYSDGMFEIRRQWPITKFFIQHTKENFPSKYEIFRASGVLPLYNTHLLIKILSDISTREYISLRMILLCLLYWPLRNLSSFLPSSLKQIIRKTIRV